MTCRAQATFLHQVLPAGTDLFEAPMHTANELEDAPVMPGLGTTLFDVSVESDKVVAHFFLVKDSRCSSSISTDAEWLSSGPLGKDQRV